MSLAKWAYQLIIMIWVLSFSACVTLSAPIEEYNLAMVALQAAKKSEALKYATGMYHKAQEACRRGQVLFEAKSYKEARQEFINCRQHSELAENLSRLERWRKGEMY